MKGSETQENKLSVGEENLGEELPVDDSPVAISWKESKDVFRKSEKERKEAVDYVKFKQKEKKRKKNELFVAQKLRKATRNARLTKLPHDIVQAIAKAANQPEDDKNSKAEGVEVTESAKHEKSRPETSKESEKFHDDPEASDLVVIVKDELIKPKKVQESAALFLTNHLYGDRIERISTRTHLSLTSKRKHKKPALKFGKL